MDQDADPAAVLLDRAALLTAARRAGCQPGHAEPPTAPDADPRPPVSITAGRRLARILSGENAELLTEWLAAAAARGLRPPPQFLPVLLDKARRVSSASPDQEEARLRGLVAAAGGPRAAWLAGLNPAWAYLLAEQAQAPPPVRLSETDLAKVTELAEAEPDANALAQLMAVVPGPWPAALTARVLAKAARELPRTPLSASRVIRLAGTRADPSMGAPGVLADFPPEAPHVLHSMLAVLRFRYEMLRELDDGRGDG
jgi:hypothetical protein